MLQFLFTMSNTRDAGVFVRTLNSRSLALSVLLGSHPPALRANALVSFAGLFEVAGGTMRTALSRLVASGELVVDDGRYRLTGPLLERQRAQDLGRSEPMTRWSGDWHTVVTVPDQRDVASRRRFRSAMTNNRFGELRPNIWMRPANLALDLSSSSWQEKQCLIVTGSLSGMGAERLAARLWDLPQIAREARALSAELELLHQLDHSDPHSIVPIFKTSAWVVRFLRSEPQLPLSLVPADWPVAPLRTEYDIVEAGLATALRAFFAANR